MISSGILEYQEEDDLNTPDDNADLSEGQWQKIAFARSLIGDAPHRILDVPTSAINTNREKELYHMFAQLAADKTAIVVTHCLGMARLADRIAVIEKGSISETGTHEELLQKNGRYSHMYQLQKEQYINP